MPLVFNFNPTNMFILSNMFAILTVLLIIGHVTMGDEECEDKMKKLIDESNNCIDQSATFQKFCDDANEATVENPDDEKIIALIPKYCTGIDREIKCTRIITNSSNECRFLSQDAVDRSEGISVAMLNFFCENDGKNFLEFALNEELKKFDEYISKNECESDQNDINLFTKDGEFDSEFCGKVDEMHDCYSVYFANSDNPNLKDLVAVLRDTIKEGAQC